LTPTASTYEQLERNFVAWAERQPDVLAAVVVGSRARSERPADDWSDLDLIVFTTDPASYAARTDWLNEIGEVWVPALDRTGPGDPEWLVLFDGGLKMDIVLTPVARTSLSQMLAASPYRFVYQSGMRVLFDKTATGESLRLPTVGSRATAHPTQEEFSALVYSVMVEAARAAKLIRRGDLWRAKHDCDCALKARLLTLLAWHAHATHGLDFETWYDGRYLDEWATPQAVAAIPATFAAYDADDLWRALLATLDLFRQLAQETAARLGYTYPAQADKNVAQWLRRFAR
jgi:aminoglycoside 6-adenylyltransferase